MKITLSLLTCSPNTIIKHCKNPQTSVKTLVLSSLKLMACLATIFSDSTPGHFLIASLILIINYWGFFYSYLDLTVLFQADGFFVASLIKYRNTDDTGYTSS